MKNQKRALQFIKQHFPNLFESAALKSIKVMKVGIKEDMISALVGQGFEEEEATNKIKKCLKLICYSWTYLDKVEVGGLRYDIHGNESGEITKMHIANVKKLKKLTEKRILQTRAKQAISRLGGVPVITTKRKSKKQKEEETKSKPFSPVLKVESTELVSAEGLPDDLKAIVQVVENRLNSEGLNDIKKLRIKEVTNKLIGLLK